MTLQHSTTTPRLTIATIATDTPMGAQAYQEQVARRAESALGTVDERDWRVRRLIMRSMRSTLAGNRRLPLSRIATASAGERRALGRLLYRGDAVTHRMSLELPPSPHGDVITVHDVVAWRFPDESAPVRAAVEEARRAAAVICVSEFSAREATELMGISEPHVVYNGVDARYFDATPLDAGARRALGLPERYVLHAGGASRRKNLEGLAEAWPIVHRERPGLELVLAGPTHPRRTALFDGMPGVRLVGRLPDEVMPGLVAGAEVVVVPSLYEGFGLPALEAMAAKRARRRRGHELAARGRRRRRHPRRADRRRHRRGSARRHRWQPTRPDDRDRPRPCRESSPGSAAPRRTRASGRR